MVPEINYEEDAADVGVGHNSLSHITSLAEKQLELEARAEVLKEKLKDTVEALQDISRKRLPQAMKDEGLSDFTLENGAKVAVKTKLTMSVSKTKKPFVLDWLKSVGEESIIKYGVAVQLPYTEETAEQIATITQFVKDMDLDAVKTDDVNTSTLKSLVTKRIKDGKPTPDLSEFGGFEITESVIKL